AAGVLRLQLQVDGAGAGVEVAGADDRGVADQVEDRVGDGHGGPVVRVWGDSTCPGTSSLRTPGRPFPRAPDPSSPRTRGSMDVRAPGTSGEKRGTSGSKVLGFPHARERRGGRGWTGPPPEGTNTWLP